VLKVVDPITEDISGGEGKAPKCGLWVTPSNRQGGRGGHVGTKGESPQVQSSFEMSPPGVCHSERIQHSSA
jgi:hypothetical protein